MCGDGSEDEVVVRSQWLLEAVSGFHRENQVVRSHRFFGVFLFEPFYIRLRLSCTCKRLKPVTGLLHRGYFVGQPTDSMSGYVIEERDLCASLHYDITILHQKITVTRSQHHSPISRSHSPISFVFLVRTRLVILGLLCVHSQPTNSRTVSLPISSAG
jgi:hypothetical protein